jgi:hypothetical protein
MSQSLSGIVSPLPNFEKFRQACVWMIFGCSFVVFFQPAPTDIMFFLTFPLFLASGLNLALAITPLFFLLFIYNFSATVSYVPVADDPEALWFILPSVYMALSAFFFAAYVSADTEKRFALVRNGYIVGATIASIVGLVHYSNVFGLGVVILKMVHAPTSWPDRASGFFKDPNVFSTYLVLPCAMLLQGYMLNTIKRPLVSAFSLVLILAALVLAFSRGAWINIVMSTALIALMTFILTPSAKIRTRVVLIMVLGIVAVAVMVAIFMSIPNVREYFLTRLTLVKDYDSGETGRFGNQMNSIPRLLRLPLGFGPYQFARIYNLAPHNTFLNAFSSCGWVGGLAYFTLSMSNIFIGAYSVLARTPYQNMSILVFACLTSVMFQGVQIDMEHWRHYYWMMGLMWGLFTATLAYQKQFKGRHSDFEPAYSAA